MSSPAETVSDWFWQIIADAKNDAIALAAILEDQSSEELCQFYTEFQWASSQLIVSPYREVASAHNDDFSEDDMADIAYWVVSEGKAFYSDVWNHPEMIAKFREEIHATDIGGVAPKVYFARFHEPVALDADLCDEYDGMV